MTCEDMQGRVAFSTTIGVAGAGNRIGGSVPGKQPPNIMSRLKYSAIGIFGRTIFLTHSDFGLGVSVLSGTTALRSVLPAEQSSRPLTRRMYGSNSIAGRWRIRDGQLRSGGRRSGPARLHLVRR